MSEPTHSSLEPLCALEPGMPVLYGGDRVARVSVELAARFRPGDRLLVVQSTGELLHVPREQHAVAAAAVGKARAAFEALGAVDDGCITRFYEEFAARLADDAVWSAVAESNAA